MYQQKTPPQQTTLSSMNTQLNKLKSIKFHTKLEYDNLSIDFKMSMTLNLICENHMKYFKNKLFLCKLNF